MSDLLNHGRKNGPESDSPRLAKVTLCDLELSVRTSEVCQTRLKLAMSDFFISSGLSELTILGVEGSGVQSMSEWCASEWE